MASVCASYVPLLLLNIKMKARVPPSIRQRLSTPQVLTHHPHGQTDSFTLYVKSAHLLSVVKSFNHRIMAKMVPLAPQDAIGREVDVRNSTEFHQVEQLISTFGINIARQFRRPVADGLIDSYLYVANVVSHL